MNNADYGTNHPTTATYDSQFTVNNPTKAGHTFTGWDISGMDNVTHTYGSSTTTNLTISKTKETTFKNLRSTSGTVTFTATWSINQYTLTVKPNGGKWNDSSCCADCCPQHQAGEGEEYNHQDYKWERPEYIYNTA